MDHSSDEEKSDAGSGGEGGKHLVLTDPTSTTEYNRFNLHLVSTDAPVGQQVTFMMALGDSSPCTLKSMGVPFTWKEMGQLQRIYFSTSTHQNSSTAITTTTTLQFPDKFFGLTFERQ